ncbi:hypothetical protein SAMN05444164_7061 [Bradyrhizobium erythrophlei]|uniref:Uncharacterized protein n=1 Tax=Bradyrhizobium erythrophlei TaxID=1437360 RepID=A0A1H5GEK0_9BRAD|nr:hypothetical protein SAMN05444164_7061 [Bradyrhizobium erythrophlei]
MWSLSGWLEPNDGDVTSIAPTLGSCGGSRWVSSSRSIEKTSTRPLAHVSLGGQDQLVRPAIRNIAAIIGAGRVDRYGVRCCRCDFRLETSGGDDPPSVRLMPERPRNAAARQYPSAGKRRNSSLSAFLLLQATGPRRPVVSFLRVRCMRSWRPFCCGWPGLMRSTASRRLRWQFLRFERSVLAPGLTAFGRPPPGSSYSARAVSSSMNGRLG